MELSQKPKFVDFFYDFETIGGFPRLICVF